MLLGMYALVRESPTAVMTMRGHLTPYGQFGIGAEFRVERSGERQDNAEASMVGSASGDIQWSRACCRYSVAKKETST